MQLKLEELTKQYGDKIALDKASATFGPGIYGLLGANGAGKTTMMRLICDIIRPTAGKVIFNGTNIRELGETYRAILGYLPQDFGYYPNFTAMSFLLYMASLKGLRIGYAKEKAAELLDMVQLFEVKDQKIKTFSGGMKRRLGIAQAFLNNPQILILDEPTAGLDPKEQIKLRKLISSFAESKIILLSTHIVTDIEYIADEVLMIKNGMFLKKGAESAIIQQISGKVWECYVTGQEVERIENQFPVCNSKTENGRIILRVIAERKPCEAAVSVMPRLEDLYLYYFRSEV